MGIYIPDAKLPPDEKYKWDLELHISYDGTVRSPWGSLITDEKAIELPPHGRLGDLDAFLANLKNDPLFPLVERYGMSGVIEAQPTIIPADKEANNV